MKHRLFAALLTAVIGSAYATAAFSQETLPPWFKEFVDYANAKFEQLEALIAQNAVDIARHEDVLANLGAPVYDFHDYTAPRNQTRIYRLWGPGACGTTETSVLTAAPQPDGSIFLTDHRQWRTSSGGLCADFVLELRFGSTEFSTVGFRIPFLGQKSTRDVGLPILTSTMRVGASWGGATRSTRTTGPVSTEFGVASAIGTLLAIEDVTVPAGTFTGCLKTSLVQNDPHLVNNTQLLWWCPERGLVRQVQVNTANSVGYERELASVEYH